MNMSPTALKVFAFIFFALSQFVIVMANLSNPKAQLIHLGVLLMAMSYFIYKGTKTRDAK